MLLDYATSTPVHCTEEDAMSAKEESRKLTPKNSLLITQKIRHHEENL